MKVERMLCHPRGQKEASNTGSRQGEGNLPARQGLRQQASMLPSSGKPFQPQNV